MSNGWCGFNGENEANQFNHEEQQEVAIVDSNGTRSVASVVSNSARRRGSLAVAHGL